MEGEFKVRAVDFEEKSVAEVEEQLIKDGLVIAEVIPYQYHITSEQNKDYLEMKKRLHIFE